MASMLELVVQCITKESEQRSDGEINNLIPWLRKMSDKFESLKEEVVFEIIKNCSYNQKIRNDIIIRQGDKGDCFYVILSGRVSIFINTEAVPDNPAESIVLVADDKNNEKKELDRSKYGNFIAQMESGKGFGELALINTDCVRNASIIADEPVQLLIVNRDLYNRSMKEAQLQEFNQRMSFVNNSELFSNWMSKYKRQVAFSLRKEKYGFNVPLVTQGAQTNGLMFILKGQAKVVVNSPLHNTQFPSLNTVNTSDVSKSVDLNEIERMVTENDGKRTTHNVVLKRLSYIDAEQRLAQKHIEICIVTGGEIIGDLEQGLELSTYCHTVITIEPIEVYILDAKNYERLINAKRNFKTLKLLRSKAINKIKYRCTLNALNNSPITFYTRLNDIIREEEEKEQRANQKKTGDNLLDGNVGQLEKVGSNLENVGGLLSQRGPLINMFGPGSVFYRNRQWRKEKRLAEEKKKKTHMGMKGQLGFSRGTRTGVVQMDHTAGSDNESLCSDDSMPHSVIGAGLPKVDGTSKAAIANIDTRIDWETTSDRLRTLEARVKDWLQSVVSMNANFQVATSTNPTVPDPLTPVMTTIDKTDFCVTLKRFNPKESEKKIIPGKKIFLTPKRPQRSVRKSVSEDSTRNKVFITAGKLTEKKRHKESTEEDRKDVTKADASSIVSDINNLNNEFHKKKALSDIQLPTITHQYTPDEYKQLKLLLRKKELEFRSYQTTLAI